MPSVRDLEQWLAKLESDERDLERQLAATRKMLSSIREALTTQHGHNTLADVTPAQSSNALRSQALLSTGAQKSKFVQVITKKGVTFAEVAKALEAKLPSRSFPRSTVQSWAKAKDDPSYRAIPQDAAEALKALFGVPMSAWPRIIPAP